MGLYEFGVLVLVGIIFLAAHLFDDYTIQIQLQKTLKACGIKYEKRGWRKPGLWLHCFTYLFAFIPIFWWMGINYWWLALIFISHLLIDKKAIRPKVLDQFLHGVPLGIIILIWWLPKYLP